MKGVMHMSTYELITSICRILSIIIELIKTCKKEGKPTWRGRVKISLNIPLLLYAEIMKKSSTVIAIIFIVASMALWCISRFVSYIPGIIISVFAAICGVCAIIILARKDV